MPNSKVIYSLIALLFLSVTGCGDGLARVEGTVTFNGEPVSRGRIVLEPVDGQGSTSGSAVEGGKFTIDKVVPGEKIVRLSAAYVVKVEKDEFGGETEICDDLLPAEYANNSKHRLVVEAPLTKKDYVIEGTDPRSNK